MFDFSELLNFLARFGYIGILFIVFLEMGVFFCFFLPGDSLLFAAGLLASRGVMNIKVLLFGVSTTVIVAYCCAYFMGRFMGPWIWSLPDRFLFKHKYLVRAQKFYEKHGAMAIISGRFVPVVRTFVPVVAGVVRMNFPRFLLVNIIGGMVWGLGVLLLGYYISRSVPDMLKHIGLILGAIIVVSIMPLAWSYWQQRKNKK